MSLSLRCPQRALRAQARSIVFALCVAMAPTLAVVPAMPASAQTEEELMAKREEWQEKYRQLLRDRMRYTDNIAKSEHNYAQAQRRNYPRGGARQQFVLDAEEARKSLEQTEAAIEKLFVDARRASIPPGWLFEVDDETISYEQPAALDGSDADEALRQGRNPLYDSDDESGDPDDDQDDDSEDYDRRDRDDDDA